MIQILGELAIIVDLPRDPAHEFDISLQMLVLKGLIAASHPADQFGHVERRVDRQGRVDVLSETSSFNRNLVILQSPIPNPKSLGSDFGIEEESVDSEIEDSLQ